MGGMTGVPMSKFTAAMAAGGDMTGGWKFDSADWWLEEHGLIMQQPVIPLPAGKYSVTGGRSVTAILTVKSDSTWSLDGGATIGDVTHGPCRSARYTPKSGVAGCSPKNMDPSAFPVAPGGTMPTIEGCDKQDYRVLIVT